MKIGAQNFTLYTKVSKQSKSTPVISLVFVQTNEKEC